MSLRIRLSLQQPLAFARDWLSRMTMARRLGLGFGLVLLLFAGTTVFAVLQMTRQEDRLHSATQAGTVVAGTARQLRDEINETYMNLLLTALATQKDDVKFYLDEMNRHLGVYTTAKARLMTLTRDGRDVPGMAEALKPLTESEGVVALIRNAVQRHAQDAAALGDDKTMEFDARLVDNVTSQVKSQVDFWAKSVQAIVAATDAAAGRAQQEAENAAVLARRVLSIAAVIGLLVGVAAAWLIGRSVTLPLRRAVAVAERVAQGDLSQAIASHSRDETGALMSALGAMQASLHAVVSSVLESARSIEVASSEVASGNNDLSQRTEHAAASLQRTTHSMTELTGSVQLSAQSASQANQVASAARTAAERGGEVVEQVIATMEKIAGQSRRIGDIIGVIDGIAFQTNILALNAAVEAARAGEQGRGFAVVASEVRALAQRSAAAAKDIKGLIGSSVDEVEAGGRLVRQAGQTMAEIVASVRQVSARNAEITASTAAQSAGIGEVSGAMSDLDRMTQQNAALVEQGAAAAASLQAQAQRLTQAVAAFRLEADPAPV